VEPKTVEINGKYYREGVEVEAPKVEPKAGLVGKTVGKKKVVGKQDPKVQAAIDDRTKKAGIMQGLARLYERYKG